MDIIELRQYTLRPGMRDVLIDLFDREFVESQEALGMRVVGQFRDEDDPDRFVWLRGFPGMEARCAALTSFYVDGAAWKEHGPAANATMLDSSDVFLLRPWSGFPGTVRPRPPAGSADLPGSRLTATVYPLDPGTGEEFARLFTERAAPILAGAGAPPLATLLTEHAENTFPRLPVREGEEVFVSLALFDDPAALDAHAVRLAGSERWNGEALPLLDARLSGRPRRLRLAPTARSLLR